MDEKYEDLYHSYDYNFCYLFLVYYLIIKRFNNILSINYKHYVAGRRIIENSNNITFTYEEIIIN